MLLSTLLLSATVLGLQVGDHHAPALDQKTPNEAPTLLGKEAHFDSKLIFEILILVGVKVLICLSCYCMIRRGKQRNPNVPATKHVVQLHDRNTRSPDFRKSLTWTGLPRVSDSRAIDENRLSERVEERFSMRTSATTILTTPKANPHWLPALEEEVEDEDIEALEDVVEDMEDRLEAPADVVEDMEDRVEAPADVIEDIEALEDVEDPLEDLLEGLEDLEGRLEGLRVVPPLLPETGSSVVLPNTGSSVVLPETGSTRLPEAESRTAWVTEDASLKFEAAAGLTDVGVFVQDDVSVPQSGWRSPTDFETDLALFGEPLFGQPAPSCRV